MTITRRTVVLDTKALVSSIWMMLPKNRVTVSRRIQDRYLPCFMLDFSMMMPATMDTMKSTVLAISMPVPRATGLMPR